MPRKPRVDIAGFHLVINRGVADRKIFYDNEDYKKFIEIMCNSAKMYNFIVHSYSLLYDHYRILMETKEENLSLAVRYINSNYAVYFNKKYNRHGHLWQGRYRSWYIFDREHLDLLVLHIEQCPLKYHLVDKLEDFKYSSYRAFLNLDEPAECLRKSYIFKKYLTQEEVKKFFDTNVIDKELKEIIDELQKINNYHKSKEHHLRQKTLQEHFENIIGKKDRDRRVYEAYLDGYTQSSIASFLGISQSTVSNIIKKLLKENCLEIICI